MQKVIMTADDSVSVRQMVAFTLEQSGYSVVEAVDGMDALEKLSEHMVDMLITDLHMPNLDGIELIKKVRSNSRYKYMPILMLTTDAQEKSKRAGRAAGATGWIVKPFNPEQLLAVIKKVLR